MAKQTMDVDVEMLIGKAPCGHFVVKIILKWPNGDHSEIDIPHHFNSEKEAQDQADIELPKIAASLSEKFYGIKDPQVLRNEKTPKTNAIPFPSSNTIH